jgi:uncharacterized OsmC-like protein
MLPQGTGRTAIGGAPVMRLTSIAIRQGENREMAEVQDEGGYGRDVVVSGRSDAFLQSADIAGHKLVGDEPPSAGGTDQGPAPHEFLLAALGTCTSMTVSMYARRKKWPLESVKVRLRHRKLDAKDCADCVTKEGTLTEIVREIELAGPLDAGQRARLMEIADKCPVHRTLTSEIKIRSREV